MIVEENRDYLKLIINHIYIQKWRSCTLHSLTAMGGSRRNLISSREQGEVGSGPFPLLENSIFKKNFIYSKITENMHRIPLANLNILRPPPPTTEKKSGSAHDCCTFTLRSGSKWICLPLVLLGVFFFMYFLWSYCALKDKTKALPQRNESQVAYYPVSWPPPPPTHPKQTHAHYLRSTFI